MDRRLVDHLVNSNLVSRAAMQRMILRATKDKTGVVEQLLDDEKIDEAQVAQELASYFELDVVDIANFSVSDTALKFISKSMADKNGVLPFAVSDSADEVSIAVFNPESAKSVIESLKTATGRRPNVLVAPHRWLKHAIRHFYFGDAWSAAPTHHATTREVAAVANELGLDDESSSEIVLDDVVVPPAPKPRQPRPAARTVIPTPPEKRQQEQRQQAQRQQPQRQQHRSQPESALDEFDAFLHSSTGWGKNNMSGIPGWDEPAENPFARDDGGWSDPSPGGFSLFDDKSEPESGGDLVTLVQQHEETIAQLQRDVQQAREIISALVDALADAKVVSKRDIKNRVKRR